MFRRRYFKAGPGNPPVERGPGAPREDDEPSFAGRALFGFVTLLVVLSVLAQLAIIDSALVERYYRARGEGWTQMGQALFAGLAILYFIFPMAIVSIVVAMSFTARQVRRGGAKLGMAFFWFAALLPLVMMWAIEQSDKPSPMSFTLLDRFYLWRGPPAGYEPRTPIDEEYGRRRAHIVTYEEAAREEAKKKARERELADARAVRGMARSDQSIAGTEYAINNGVGAEADCPDGPSAFVAACKAYGRRQAQERANRPAVVAPPRTPRAATGTEVRAIHAHAAEIWQVVFSPDGRRIASAAHDGTVKIWDVETGTEVRTFITGGRFYSLAFSPDGKMVAGGEEDGSVTVWNADTGAERRLIRSPPLVYAVAFSRDGRYLATGNMDARLQVWELASGREVMSAKDGYFVTWIGFSSDDRTILAGDANGWVRFWNLADGRQERVLSGFINAWNRIAMSPDGRLVVHGGGFRTSIWDAQAQRDIALLGGTEQPNKWLLFGFAFLSDNRTLVTAGGDFMIRTWDAQTGEMTALVGTHEKQVKGLAASPDGKLVASGSDDGVIKLWRLP